MHMPAMDHVRHSTPTPCRTTTPYKKNNALKQDTPAPDQDNANELHKDWVKLQQSIQVDGFETGQITTAHSNAGRKNRGGKVLRKKREREMELVKKTEERERMMSDLGGGEYPPLRYSNEETERLLKMAYDNIPERTGKRGTRNLKRQQLRWMAVRKARKKKKKEKLMAHFRRMEKRSRIVKEVLEVKATSAALVATEKEYQTTTLRRWVQQTTRETQEQE